jgi:hypothetical protein
MEGVPPADGDLEKGVKKAILGRVGNGELFKGNLKNLVPVRPVVDSTFAGNLAFFQWGQPTHAR